MLRSRVLVLAELGLVESGSSLAPAGHILPEMSFCLGYKRSLGHLRGASAPSSGVS